jgi:hypothetical protein
MALSTPAPDNVDMTSRRISLALVLAASTVLVLVGCAPAVITPTPSTSSTASPTPTPTPTPPALDTSAPAAQIATPCSTLLTPRQLLNWQGPGTSLNAPAAVAAGDLANPVVQIPVSDYVRAAGGLDCLWSAAPFDHYSLSPTAPAYLEVTVQFDATAEYNENADSMGAINGRAGECDGDDPGSICQLDDLVGSTWIEIDSRHAVGTGNGGNGIEPVETAVLAALQAAGPPTGVPALQPGTTTLGSHCSQFASTAAVQTAVGSAAAVTAVTPKQVQEFGSALSTPLWYPSQDALKDHPCVFVAAGKTQAEVTWIPGGAWAWSENATQTLTEAPLQNLQLTGEGPHDTASLRCAASGTSCTVDLVLGGNWIEVTVPPTSSAANRQDAVTKIAQNIVTTVG